MAGSATVEKRLDFGLLGPLQMTIDGTPVPSGTPKQRAVLAMLVINRNRPVGVDALITALWEEWPPSGARASIHSYVSNLRKLLGGAGIDPRVVLAAGRRVIGSASPTTLAIWGGLLPKKPRACTRPPPAGSNKPAATCRPH